MSHTNRIGNTSSHGLNRTETFNQARGSSSATSHGSHISKIRNNIQRLQGSIQTTETNQASSTQNGSSHLDLESATATPTSISTTSPSTSPMQYQGHIMYVDPVTGTATCGGPRPETPSLTSDQKNKISELLIDKKLETIMGGTDAGNIYGDQTIDGLVGEIASILGDESIHITATDSQGNPIRRPGRDSYTGISGKIMDQFRNEQEYDANGAPLPINTHTIDQILNFIKDLPGEPLTQEYNPEKKEDTLKTFNNMSADLVTRLKAALNGQSAEDPAALIAELAKLGEAQKVLKGANANLPALPVIPHPDPVGPTPPTLGFTKDAQYKVVTLLKNAIQESKTSDIGNVFRDQHLDGIVGEIASILGDQPIHIPATDAQGNPVRRPGRDSYTGISGQIMDKFRGEQRYDANGAPLALSTDTLTRMVLFVENIPTQAAPVNKLKETQSEEIKFSNYKIDFYKNQSKGLDNLFKQWQGVNDSTGHAKAQMAQISSQSALVNGTQSFWTTEQNFWKDESTVKYKDKDLTQVQSIYDKIRKAENKYDEAVFNNGNRGVSDANKELKGLKSDLAKIRGYETQQPTYKDPEALTEVTFSQFKMNQYGEQKTQLALAKQPYTARLLKNPNDAEAKAKAKELTAQRNLVNDAREFWKGERTFWNKLGQAGLPSSMSEQDLNAMDSFKHRLTDLENQMDQWLTVTDKTGEASTQRNNIARQIARVKSQIYTLHPTI